MTNRLAMDKVQAIKSLHASGMSERRIAETLGISRKGVRRHLGQESPKDTKAPTGEAPSGSTDPKDTNAPTGSEGRQPSSKTCSSRSECEGFRELVIAKLELGLTAKRIHQDLQKEHGFEGKYSSVRRFVRQLIARPDFAFRRIEVDPGFEMQVDYGSGARCKDHQGTYRKTHVFRLVMSHSRKGYTEAVRRLTTESFIRSLENAFRSLGGVPKFVVFDNAKAVVSQADWYDPELNPKIVEFCRHYKTTLLPTRPGMPRHKDHASRCTSLERWMMTGVKGIRSEHLSPRCLTGPWCSTGSYRYCSLAL